MKSTHYVPIKFARSSKSYFFGTILGDLRIGDKVVAESARGLQVGEVTGEPIPIEQYKSALELKPLLRKADSDDLLLYDEHEKKAKVAIKIATEEIEKLGLDMRPIDAEYSLDGSKITITYVADDRVDFRELLKVLAYNFRCRIELRQIGSRDKARIVGGIGVCGLPLCCTTFLDQVEGISINRAKNQMLALNIPKLSGQCGKLVCCLLFEDDAYTELKKDFPRIGTTIKIEDEIYHITSINVLSRMIKLDSDDNVQFLPLEEVKKLMGEKQVHEKPKFRR